MSPKYYLGCPVWSCEAWVGSLYRRKLPRKRWLEDYSAVFSTVEGNSTFYALPQASTVEHWCQVTQDGFRFSLKFPRAISHDQRLVSAEPMTGAFLELLQILQQHDRLGPSFLQLPPDFGPSEFENLVRYCESLPDEFPYAVEVRQFGYYDEGPNEQRLDGMLRENGIDKVLFDSRPLYSAPPTTETERVSQGRKPRTPLRKTTTGDRPFVRFIGRDETDRLKPWIEEWSQQTVEWIQAGKTPFIMTHAPDDTYAPEFARLFHEAVKRRLPETPLLAEWPGKAESQSQLRQLELF